MQLTDLIARLRRNARTFERLLSGLDDELVRWRPAPRKWSLLLVVNHLADEERDDFKLRLDHLLHRPGGAWPAIDPEGWVVTRAYAEQDYAATLERFLAERARSLDWLAGLSPPDWSMSSTQRTLGTLTAGDLMAAWVDHDYLHMRQALGLLHGSLCAAVAPHSTGYAGTW